MARYCPKDEIVKAIHWTAGPCPRCKNKKLNKWDQCPKCWMQLGEYLVIDGNDKCSWTKEDFEDYFEKVKE